MKLFSKVLFVTASLLPSALPAASPAQTLQVHVPFAFMVGDKQMAAGDYRVQQTDTGILFVQGEGQAAAAITVPGELKAGSLTSLRFTSGQQHEHLAGVQVQGESARNLILPTDSRRVTLASSR